MRALGIAVVAVALLFAPASLAQQAAQSAGTPDEAKAMLRRAAAAVRADKDKALFLFNNGDGGFKDRDLYPFCVNIGDGKMLANGFAKQLIGQDARALKDSTGKAFGQEVYDTVVKAKDGEVIESTPFLFARPGADATPVPKVIFVEKIGDIFCGVGYYK
jgi:Single Cache domain 2